MKKYFFILLFALTFSLSALAQEPPHPGGGNPPGSGDTPVGGGAPLDGGLSLLITMGLFYSGRKMFSIEKQKNY